jgi:hypothetical protein
VSRAAALALGAVLFVLVSTANSGGYRFGVSDQAFYIPAIAIKEDPSRFPHDRPLIEPQMRLWLGASLVAWPVSLDDNRFPRTFFAIYLVTLGLLFIAGVTLARSLGVGAIGTAIFLVLLTVRHRIPRTGANSLEGYMHPRMLAFAIGLFALASIARHRMGPAFAAAIAATFVHPTTGGWFLIVLATSAVWSHRQARWLRLVCGVAAVLAVGLVALGVSSGRLARMDPAWMKVFEDRDYLFPAEWPFSAWLLNLAYPAVILLIHRARRNRRQTTPGEDAMVAGLVGLVVFFLLSVPFTVLRVALAVQLQTNRVFWLLDAATAAYVAWWIADTLLHRSRPVAYAAAGLLAAAAVARGGYLLTTEQRPLVAVDLPVSSWTQAMDWLRARPERWQVVADPNHVYKYGPSVRIAALQDVVVDASKDPALAIYDRGAAMHVAEREEALQHFDDLSVTELRQVARQYGGDVLIDRRDPPRNLPVLYSNHDFVVYSLK